MATSPIVSAPVTASSTEIEELNLTLRELIEQKDAQIRALLADETARLDSAVGNLAAPSAPDAFERYQYVRSAAVSSTNSTGWQRKLNLNGFELPLGTYRIGWAYRYNNTSNNTDFLGRLLMNGEELFRHAQTPNEQSRTFLKDGLGQYQHVSGFDVIENLSGTVDFDLEYATGDRKHTASIWKAVLELRRIA